MTMEEVFSELYDKYGKNFNWHMIPLSQSNGTFVEELKKEIGKEHFLYNKRIWAVAKSQLNDDVLYVTGSGAGTDIYYIFHLIYSEQNPNEIPLYEEFSDIYAVKEFIEQSYIENRMQIRTSSL